MAAKRTIQRRRSDSARSKSQQRNRRRRHLLLKTFEYCKECDADVSITIRLRHNGQIFFFNSDGGWHLSQKELAMYYPKPKEVTWQELAAQYKA
ncbi:hypothetical protein BDV29DRAFT_163263 [Aspergillus leporis]|uniref:MADS-box domain-containing protein n=1 Tax=Aspergillus leporis TaxID=41062 RepID=A0A5N5WIF3_9EURO|nr:hypothetical protein BDV29DRAFT_163263 [Aspergillus leporis]